MTTCLSLFAAILAGCTETSAPDEGPSDAVTCKPAFQTLDYPGAQFTNIIGVNDAGAIVGRFGDGNGNVHGFIKQQGRQFQQLDVPGSILTAALAINNQDVAVGHYVDGDRVTHGFVYRGGRFQTVDYPGATDTRIRGIDDRGTLMGNFGSIADGIEHGFIKDDSGFHLEDYPGSATSDIWASDDEGHFVGDWSDTEDNVFGLALDSHHFTSFAMPGPFWATSARSILHSGVIVGVIGETDVIIHGFIKTGDQYRQVDYPGAVATETTRANNHGLVVGDYTPTLDSPDHGFLLTTCLQGVS
jgi:hypothetical protein